MQITIDAFWLYGFQFHKIGSSKVQGYKAIYWFTEKPDRTYDSPYLACNDLANDLYYLQREIHYSDRVRVLAQENIICVKIEASTDGLNSLPSQETLQSCKDKLFTTLAKLGFNNLPEPELFFWIKVE